jgi:hypothetical protein
MAGAVALVARMDRWLASKRPDYRALLQPAPVQPHVLRADDELGASVFWVRPEMLLGEPLEQFLAFWQTKRDGKRRGIVEIVP